MTVRPLEEPDVSLPDYQPINGRNGGRPMFSMIWPFVVRCGSVPSGCLSAEPPIVAGCQSDVLAKQATAVAP